MSPEARYVGESSLITNALIKANRITFVSPIVYDVVLERRGFL
jgi:hypothetical protein